MMGGKAYAWIRKNVLRKSVYPLAFDLHQAIFIHIPKTGGTSLGRALFQSGRTGHFEWFLYRFEEPEKFERYFKFAFVRHPLDRFLSAYNYLILGGKNSVDAALGEDILRYGDINQFIETGFFDAHFCKQDHFIKQVEFICDRNCEIMVDFVGRFENLERDSKKIAERLGVDCVLDVVNATKVKSANRNSISFRNLERLQRYYKADYSTFGYL